MAATEGQDGTDPAVPDPAAAEVPPALRAQLLAIEHSSLLATRATTWSEVMSRISIHLTIVSAALVVIALVTQQSGFGTGPRVLAIGLTAAVLVLGTLTWVRVLNASADDTALIMGMNRLRAAYLEIDPTLSRYLITSGHDDPLGVMETYTLGAPRQSVSHIVGSTSVFLNLVNAMVAGTLGALIPNTAGLGAAGTAIIGVLGGLVYFAGTTALAASTFTRPPVQVHFPHQS